MHKNSKARRWLRLVAGNILILCLLLTLVEGVASFLLVARNSEARSPVAERKHTQYDPELGWVNVPDLSIPDMYGPGVYLKTNRQGFRNEVDFEVDVPDDKTRVICSGDSFTLGYGVSNSDTWCQLLMSLDPRLETVNMGQGGYGVDQAYLWFKRDGGKINHDVQILAFITEDFRRMQSDQFRGYGKPQLALENGQLAVRNVPVPRGRYLFPWLATNREILDELRTTELIKSRWRVPISENDVERSRETQEVLLKIFEESKRLNQERSSQLVLVYLPVQSELQGDRSEEWIEFVKGAALTLDLPLINLGDELFSMPYEDASKLFNPSDLHYNELGHKVVAKVVAAELESLLW